MGHICRVKQSKHAVIIWLWYAGICVALNERGMNKFVYDLDLSYVDSCGAQFAWSLLPSTKIWHMSIWARGQGSVTSDQITHKWTMGVECWLMIKHWEIPRLPDKNSYNVEGRGIQLWILLRLTREIKTDKVAVYLELNCRYKLWVGH